MQPISSMTGFDRKAVRKYLLHPDAIPAYEVTRLSVDRDRLNLQQCQSRQHTFGRIDWLR
jgi:hypothetical protein